MDKKRGIMKNDNREKLHEGQQKGNVKPATSPKPKVVPAPQKLTQK
jgi:hypothetical protein